HETRGERDGIFFGFFRRVDDLVVDVGVIAHVVNFEAAVAQVANDGVERRERARVADVHEAVDGGAADVDADFARREGRERLLADDPRPQRVTQYPVKRSPRKSGEEAIPTSVFDTEKHDEELRAVYGADPELGYKPIFLYVERGPGMGQLVQVKQGQLVVG